MSSVNVITAGPSSGKSSIIRELSARGYRTVPESASLFINQKISEGESPEEARSNYEFQQRLCNIDRQMEDRLGNEVVFLDRSLADNIAYMKHHGKDIPSSLIEECRDRYDNIFLLERLNFKDNKIRNEDEEEAQEIHRLIRETYLELDYSVNEIPVVPIDERADMVLDRLDGENESPYRETVK
jgi:predicted ATPase